ncbi:MAG: SagB-type dehydrogenase domain-containing protein [Candidatus Saganbacteria bacterium]|uniref:SagB-type dehydrogenase domain-containing protein n=1 Tax=Candidatus Saganbacteria bacterium TaxID=2575572 RepID=A0A833NS63_UNCSA|nr:MAG: SagB-type dehydrogenase domain-containing protein [Candidatus Saganbacteria bacterium]
MLVVFLLINGSAFAKEIIKLPLPKTNGKMSLEEALYHRRSERSFYNSPLSNEQIAQLLWAAQGITENTWRLRTAPSSGAIYPLELYLVNSLGVYRYLPESHSLELHLKGDKRLSLMRASLGQQFVGEAGIIVIVCADFEKSRAKYGLRADRYVPLEGGHAAQNILLQSVALGLGAVPVGSFWDDVVMAVIALPYCQEPLYLIPIGYIKQT